MSSPRQICPHCQREISDPATDQTPQRRLSRVRNWEEIDWSKSTSELARELNTTVFYISQRRSVHAPETLSRHQRTDWSGVDWQKTNAEIARQIGRSVSYVSSQRGIHGSPAPRGRRALAWTGTDWTKSDIEIARLRQVSRQAVQSARRRYNDLLQISSQIVRNEQQQKHERTEIVSEPRRADEAASSEQNLSAGRLSEQI